MLYVACKTIWTVTVKSRKSWNYLFANFKIKGVEYACYGLFTLPDTDSDPNPGTDICPKNTYSSDWGSESE